MLQNVNLPITGNDQKRAERAEIIHFHFNNPVTKTIAAIRVMAEDGSFVATDIAKVLGYRDAATAIKSLRPHQINGTHRVRTVGRGVQEMVTITEGGLYRLIMLSKRAEAAPFQDWVTDYVLPTLRKTGKVDLTRPQASPSPAAINPETLAAFGGFLGSVSAFLPELHTDAKQLLLSKLSEQVFGMAMLPAPEAERFTQTSQIAKLLGVSSQSLGKFANKAGLKAVGNGKMFYTHTPKGKAVPQWHWNDAGRDKLIAAYRAAHPSKVTLHTV